MKNWLTAMVYTCLALLANPASAADMAEVAALREGDMLKLALHETPKPLPDIAIIDASDAEHRLSDHAGNWLVVNFWATWCAPCRKEMPTLANLQTAMDGKPVEVVTIATGRNPVPAIDRFLDDIGVTNLPKYRDPRQKLAQALGILGLPTTIIVDPEGREVGRLVGEAHWDSENALAILDALGAGS